MYQLCLCTKKAPKFAGAVWERMAEAEKKARSAARRAITALGIYAVYTMNSINAFAVTIKHDYTVKDMTNVNPEGLILGLAFWICRIIGVAMLVWGIYGYVTARKDGEAESMNGAIGKLISGVVLIAMPNVLKGLDII